MMNERMKQRRKELGLTQPAVAKSIGLTKATVSLWESGSTSPKGENLHALAKVLNCTPEYLLYGETAKKPESNAEWAGGFETWDSSTPLGDDEVEIPFYMEVELAAGAGIAEAGEYFGPKLRFAKSTLRGQGVSAPDAVCVKVAGNSMEPVLPHGSTVGVDTSKVDIIDGKMYAINHDGMLRVKMLYKLPGGGIRLRSYNTEEWKDENISFEQLKNIKIIGKVFWYSVLI
ncbi:MULTISPECIES: helix-turn-helix transcriptional regulator [unclassified Shewanella]|uniref:helix-turn-helix transcriptional regulator n=1 Tax=unclassified Shewanella TaxID=196818 RepID=UPI0021D81BE8|nr:MULTISPECIES: helix-turn-helix transcriptional regulator [unclassified Shewanella]MCU8034397.1 helix-turn-helix transcriptional regulator [Shewanella sp. SM71]MCU8096104.1 helix-turn-helix transcriptional regulator [Shewanella sp. SM102]